jgi:hypothetical protein
LLSADPAAAVSQLLWQEGDTGMTALADATVVAWEEVARPGSSEAAAGADATGPESFSVAVAAYDEVMSQTRAAFMDSSLAAQDAAYARFMGEVLASPGMPAGSDRPGDREDAAGDLVLGVPTTDAPPVPASLALGDLKLEADAGPSAPAPEGPPRA